MFASSHFVGQSHLRLSLLSAWPDNSKKYWPLILFNGYSGLACDSKTTDRWFAMDVTAIVDNPNYVVTLNSRLGNDIEVI